MIDPTVLAQRQMEEDFRRKMQREEVDHKATVLAAFYTKLVEGGVPEDEAFSLTQVWLEHGMLF